MTLSTVYFKDFSDLKSHIKGHKKTLFLSSQTSTVIPFQFINDYLGITKDQDFSIGHLSSLPPTIELIENNLLKTSGGVTWHDSLAYCRSLGRDLMSWPTEESANMLAGLATSATGERSFAFGTLREQVEAITFIDSMGNEVLLSSKKKLIDHPLFENFKEDLLSYQNNFLCYSQMKNAPFPRLLMETDLMIGMEGQLGVIKEAIFKTIPFRETKFLMVPLPRWEQDYKAHLEIFNKVQSFRGKIYSTEFFDRNSVSYLFDSGLPKENDFVILEVVEEFFEEVLDGVISNLKLINSDNIFEVTRKRYHEIRGGIPRKINEVNSQSGVVKKGTDAQVVPNNFEKLLQIYREMADRGISYCLLGHFGDGHLHFNFLPQKGQILECEGIFRDFYKKIRNLNGSPFAEHGIGMIKKEFIKDFLNPSILRGFQIIKEKLDPFDQFFPQGFLNLYKDLK